MRPLTEVREALATLERAIEHFPPGALDHALMAGEIAALRYVLRCERLNVTLADTLPELRAVLREIDVQRN